MHIIKSKTEQTVWSGESQPVLIKGGRKRGRKKGGEKREEKKGRKRGRSQTKNGKSKSRACQCFLFNESLFAVFLALSWAPSFFNSPFCHFVLQNKPGSNFYCIFIFFLSIKRWVDFESESKSIIGTRLDGSMRDKGGSDGCCVPGEANCVPSEAKHKRERDKQVAKWSQSFFDFVTQESHSCQV